MISRMNDADSSGEFKKPERKPRAKGNYRVKLRTPDKTVLAYCPTRRAGLRTASVIFDELEVTELEDGTLELRSGGVLRATIGR